MSTNIETWLDEIDNILEAGSKVPLSNKIGIDAKALKTAIENSGKDIPLHIVTISPDGKIIR